MYKIDLHCHTKKIPNKDSKERELTPENYDKFIEMAVNNNLKIISPTNHNYIDFDQFEELRKKGEEKGIVFLPGIEVDFTDNEGNQHAMNLVFNPKKINEIQNWYKKEFVKNGANYDPKNYKELFEKFCSTNIDAFFILPNNVKQSNGKVNISEKELQEIMDYLEKKEKSFFLEVTDSKNKEIILGNNLPAIKCSDSAEPLEIYKENFSEVPISLNSFESFKKFYLYSKESNLWKENFFGEKNFLGNKIINSKKQNEPIFNFKIQKDDISLHIVKGTNVIFGRYASGKTKILEHIEIILKKEKKEKISFFRNNKSLEDYGEIIKRKEKYLLTNIEDITNKIQTSDFDDKKYEKILNFENIYNNFQQLYSFAKSKESERFGYLLTIKKKNNDFVNEENFNKFLEKIKVEKTEISNDNIKTFERYKDELQAKNINFDNIKNNIEDLKRETLIIIQEKVYEKAKLLIKSKFYYTCIDNLQNILKDKKGLDSIPNELGIEELVKTKLDLYKRSNEIINFDISSLNNKAETIGEIDNESFNLLSLLEYNKRKNFEKIEYGSNQNFEAFNPKYLTIIEIDNLFSLIKKIHKKVKESKELLESLKSFNVKIDEWKKAKPEKDLDNINYKFLLKRKLITVNGSFNEIEISDGQKKLLTWQNYINSNDKEIFLFDEPEISLDNKSVVNMIIKEIKKAERNGKTIVTVTHNSNIIVLTKPLNIIYRKQDIKGYHTFISNHFDDLFEEKENLDKSLISTKNILMKKETMLDIVEGGKTSFEVRKEYYE